MSQKQFQVRHNMPQVALQNTLQTSKAFGLRVSPINIIPLTTKADNNIHRRPILEDNHLDSNSKLGYEAHNKKLVPPLRKGLYSRANLDLDRKKELPSIEKLPKSAPNNLNARLHLKQGLRPHGMRIGEDNKHKKPPLRRCEDKENDDLSGLRSMIDKEGLSTQRELKIGSQDDVMTEVTSSDGNTMINEGLKTKLSLEGPDIKYNRKCRVGSRGQDNGSDLVEEDIFEDKTSRNEMDFTLAQLTPEKSGQRRELDTQDFIEEKADKYTSEQDSINFDGVETLITKEIARKVLYPDLPDLKAAFEKRSWVPGSLSSRRREESCEDVKVVKVSTGDRNPKSSRLRTSKDVRDSNLYKTIRASGPYMSPYEINKEYEKKEKEKIIGSRVFVTSLKTGNSKRAPGGYSTLRDRMSSATGFNIKKWV